MFFLQKVWVDLQVLRRYLPIQTILWLSHCNHVWPGSFLFFFCTIHHSQQAREGILPAFTWAFWCNVELTKVPQAPVGSQILYQSELLSVCWSNFQLLCRSKSWCQLASAGHTFQCHPHLLLALILCPSVSDETIDLSLGIYPTLAVHSRCCPQSAHICLLSPASLLCLQCPPSLCFQPSSIWCQGLLFLSLVAAQFSFPCPLYEIITTFSCISNKKVKPDQNKTDILPHCSSTFAHWWNGLTSLWACDIIWTFRTSIYRK